MDDGSPCVVVVVVWVGFGCCFLPWGKKSSKPRDGGGERPPSLLLLLLLLLDLSSESSSEEGDDDAHHHNNGVGGEGTKGEFVCVCGIVIAVAGAPFQTIHRDGAVWIVLMTGSGGDTILVPWVGEKESAAGLEIPRPLPCEQ